MLQIKRKVPEPLDFVKGLLISADKIPRALSKELNQSQGGMCICLRRGIVLGIRQQCFGP